MKVNKKKGKSEVMVFGTKERVREEGWRMGQDVLEEVFEATCVGMLFQKSGCRDEYVKRRVEKVGGMVSMLGEVRRMMGEEAAMLAYRSFIRSVLGFGCDVMVLDRVGARNKMDVVQRKALRVVLELDHGVRNEVLYGEAGEDRLSAQAEWCGGFGGAERD